MIAFVLGLAAGIAATILALIALAAPFIDEWDDFSNKRIRPIEPRDDMLGDFPNVPRVFHFGTDSTEA